TNYPADSSTHRGSAHASAYARLGQQIWGPDRAWCVRRGASSITASPAIGGQQRARSADVRLKRRAAIEPDDQRQRSVLTDRTAHPAATMAPVRIGRPNWIRPKASLNRARATAGRESG